MDRNPKVSIVTVVFNGALHLEKTILSVINQTYLNIEYIIIDGGSTDGTVDIIKKYSDRISYWVSESDDGIADAFNKGIKVSTGEIIGLINASDYYAIDAVQNIITCYRNSMCDVIYGNIVFCDVNGTELKKSDSSYTRLYYYMSIPHQSVFVKKSIYEKYGYFDTNFKIAMDYELMLRLFVYQVSFKNADEVIAYYCEGGVSNKNFVQSLKEMGKAQIKNIPEKTIRFLSFIYLVYILVWSKLITKFLKIN